MKYGNCGDILNCDMSQFTRYNDYELNVLCDDARRWTDWWIVAVIKRLISCSIKFAECVKVILFDITALKGISIRLWCLIWPRPPEIYREIWKLIFRVILVWTTQMVLILHNNLMWPPLDFACFKRTCLRPYTPARHFARINANLISFIWMNLWRSPYD